MTLHILASVLAVHLLAVMSPGPSFAVSLRVAMHDGVRAVCALSLGFGLGILIWATGALFGLSLLFELVPQLARAIQIVGAGFLAYIAVMIWRHAANPLPLRSTDTPDLSPARALRLGLMTNLTNPKALVFFGAIFSAMVPPHIAPGWMALLLLGLFLNETLWYILVAALITRPRPRATYTRLKTPLDRALAVIIFGFAVKIALG